MRRQEEEAITAPVRLTGISGSTSYGNFTKIEAWDGKRRETLWENYKTAPVQMTVGRNWELLCTYSAYNDAGFFNVTVSVRATGVPSAYQKQALGDRVEFPGSVSKTKGFNMGAMPNSPVTVRVRLWMTDYWTTDKPPEAEW